MSNRRQFLKGLGAFMILPGAGRVWKGVRAEAFSCAPYLPVGEPIDLDPLFSWTIMFPYRRGDRVILKGEIWECAADGKPLDKGVPEV